MSEYTEQAEKFLQSHNLEFRAVLVGDDCPRFCEDALADRDMDKVNTFPRKTHIHGKHYRCTISGQGRGHVSFDFWNSYADEEQNHFVKAASPLYRDGNLPRNLADMVRKYRGKKLAKVTAYDLLAAIEKGEVGTFEEFCSEFGYDTDSRRAEETYHAVQTEVKKVRKFFTPAELEELQEIS